VTILRALLLVGGAVITIASLLVERPGVFALLMPASLVLFLVGCGLAASDSIPLRPVPLAASLLAAATGVIVVARADRPIAIALGVLVVVAQALAWWTGRGGYTDETDATTRVEMEAPPASSSAEPSATASASGPRATQGSMASPYEPPSGGATAPP
jgi:nitrogen fixation-related uncharacterized protein